MKGKLLQTRAKEEQWYSTWSFSRTTSRRISLQREIPKGLWASVALQAPPGNAHERGRRRTPEVRGSVSKMSTGVGGAFTYTDVYLSTAVTEGGCISARNGDELFSPLADEE